MRYNALFVCTSHQNLGDTGEKTGVWLDELATPYYVLKDAGVDVTIVSPKGGEIPIDANSLQKDALTPATSRFTKDPGAQADIKHSKKLDSVDAEDFDLLFLPGGHGPMWDLSDNQTLNHILQVFEKRKRPIGAVCHGPAGLLSGKFGTAQHLIKGKRVTAFTDEEEKEVGLKDVVPFSLEKQLEKHGAKFEKAGPMEVHVVTDGNLVTGQNPASAGPTARMLLSVLEKTYNKAA